MIDPLHDCIQFLNLKKINDYPIVGDDWKVISSPIEKAIDNGDNGKFQIIYEMGNILANIEQYGGEIGVLKIASFLSIFILRSIKKIFYVLFTSLSVIFFNYVSNFQIINNVHIKYSIMFLIIFFTFTSILELLLHLTDYYREYCEQQIDDELKDSKNS